MDSESVEQAKQRYAQYVWQYLQKYGAARGWDMAPVLVYVINGKVRLDFSAKTYLKFQDKGTRPFLMTALTGRTVPLPGGPRVVSHVGEPGWVEFERNGVQVRKWRGQRWRHPGIEPAYFVEKAKGYAEDMMGPELRRAMAVSRTKILAKGFRDAMAKRRARG